MVPGLLPIFLHGCEIKSGSGLGTKLLVEVQWPEEGLNSSTPQQDVEQGQPSRLYPSPAFHYPAFDHKIEGEGLGIFIRTKSRQKECIQALEF